jgi:glycosyltransferase involved in cell wall biosynthesis
MKRVGKSSHEKLESQPDRDSLSILLIGTQMATGGAQKLLLEQALWYQSNGYRVTPVFFYDRDGLQEEWQQKVDFPLLNLKAFEPGASLIRRTMVLLRGIWRLWRLIRANRYDAIITFTHDSNILGLPLAWLARVPVRVATHLGVTSNTPRWRELFNSWLVNANMGQVLVAASEKTRENAIAEGVRPDRIVVIPNGITPPEPKIVDAGRIRQQVGLNAGDIFLLVVGRLVYEKGHEFLIRAMSIVTRQHPHAKAVICGDGPLKAQLELLISQNALTDQVKLLGSVDDLSEIYSVADIFVLPSRSEGLPLALLEAMASGLPVIATRVQGVGEVVDDGIHGLLVPLEDPDALGEAITKLVSDPESRHNMGVAAQLRVMQNYTTERMCERYLDLIRDRSRK